MIILQRDKTLYHRSASSHYKNHTKPPQLPVSIDEKWQGEALNRGCVGGSVGKGRLAASSYF